MFGSSKNEKTTTNTNSSFQNPTSSQSINSIVAGTKISGDITATGDIRIDGELTGSLNCDGKVIIGPSGKMNGNIECNNAMIEGNLLGNIECKELLHILESANVEGEVNTTKLLVQSGAVFNVTCSMGGKKMKNFAAKDNGKKDKVLDFVNE